LQQPLAVFARRWGDTGWRALIDDVTPTADLELRGLIGAVAGIEDDAYYMQRKLGASGLLRFRSVNEYNSMWLTEEGDHGRAFRALAARLGGAPQTFELTAEHGTFSRDPRAALALASLWAARPARASVLAGYLVRGALVELVASAVYGGLVRRLRSVDQSIAAEIVRRILMQEGRHLRFFMESAKMVLGGRPRVALAVRRATESTWRPPGVDLFGFEGWAERFAPLLRDELFVHEVWRIDNRVSKLPGFEGSETVARFWVRSGLAARVR
jgi:hypothetical protein